MNHDSHYLNSKPLLVLSSSPFIAQESCSSNGETKDMSCSSYYSDNDEQVEEDDDVEEEENEQNSWRLIDEDYRVEELPVIHQRFKSISQSS